MLSGDSIHRLGLGLSNGILLGFRNIGTSILTVVDPLAFPSLLSWQRSDNLKYRQSFLNPMTEASTHFHSRRDTQEVDETNVLISHNLDLVDRSKPAQLIPQILLICLRVQVTNKHISGRLTACNSRCNGRMYHGGLTPSDFQFLSVESKLLDASVSVEGGCGRPVEEGDEDTGLFRKETNSLNGAESNKVEKFIDGGLGRKVTDVHCSSCRVSSSGGRGSCSSRSVVTSHSIGIHGR